MVADEAADDDNNGSGNEDVVSPGFYFSDAKCCSDSQDNKADNHYNRGFSHFRF